MTRGLLYLPQHVDLLERELQILRGRVDRITNGGVLRIDPGNVIGSLPLHRHEGDAEGGYLVFNGGISGKIDWLQASQTLVGLPATGKTLRNYGLLAGIHALSAIYPDGSVRCIEIEVNAGAPSSTRKIGSPYVNSSDGSFWINNNGSTGWTRIGPAYAAAASCNSELTMTTAYQDVPGMTITVPDAGTYIVITSLRISHDGVTSQLFQCLVDGAAEAGIAISFDPTDGSDQNITHVWKITTTGANKVVKIQAKKSGAGGSGAVKATNSNMVISGNGASAAPTGGTIIVQEDDSTVDAAVTTLDFTEPDATLVSSSPAGEANINMALYTLLSGRSAGQKIFLGPAGDTDFFIGYHAGSFRVLNFDANDYYLFDRAANQHQWSVGSVQMYLDANGDITLARYLNGADIRSNLIKPVGTDSNLSFGLLSGLYIVNFDANDYIDYDRTSNIYRFNIGGALKFDIDSSGNIHPRGNLTLDSGKTLNGAVIDGALIKPVSWQANYKHRLASGLYALAFDANDYIDYDRTSNLYRFYVGGSIKFDISSTGVIHPRDNITMDSGKTVDGVDVSALSGVDAQAANKGFMGPTSGGSAAPTFRLLVAADIPVSTLYSIWDYRNVPDAAVDVAVTAADQQGVIDHSGPSAETATDIFVDAETAPGASGLPVTFKYGDTNDLDTVATWTTIATLTLSSEKSSTSTSMTNASIPANRLIQCNIGTIVGTPKNVTARLRVKRPISA